MNVSNCVNLKKLTFEKLNSTSLRIIGHNSIKELECSKIQLNSLDVSGCTSLEKLTCSNIQLTTLDVSGCTSLKSLICDNNKIKSVIPDWFSQLTEFKYDARYRYWTEEDNDGKIILKHEDLKIGWWHPEEPYKYK